MIGRAFQAAVDVMDMMGDGPGEAVLERPSSPQVHPDPVAQRQ
jgi:hypothetical protein